MKNSKLLVLGMLFLGIMFLGFQCASTELTSAKLYYDQKNYEKAIEMLNAEVTKNPKSDEGYFLLGMVYNELDQPDKMIEAFKNSLAISNKFEKNIEDKKYEVWGETMNKGLAYYNRSIKLVDTDSVKILLEKAIPNFQSATIIEPDSVLGYQFLAYSLLRNNQYDEAITALKKMVELNKAVEGYAYLGKIFYNKGLDLKKEDKLTEANEQFNQAIEILSEGKKYHPDDEDIITTLFNSYVDAGRSDEALEESKALVQKDPMNPVNHYNYGVILLGLNMYEEAVQEYTKAIEIDKEYINAKINLGFAYVKWGTAMNKEAEQKGILSEDYKKKYEAALPYLEYVVEKDPTNMEIWELLGKVYSVLGMNDDANNAFKKADELR